MNRTLTKRSLATQATILIVDSDPLLLTAMAAVLNLSGHECHCARNSVTALKAARGLSLDLVVCDNDLPEGAGIQLCRGLKREPGARDAAIIILASPGAAAQWEPEEFAGEYRLDKPIEPRALQEIVERALWLPHLVRTRLESAHVTPGAPLGNMIPGSAISAQQNDLMAQASTLQR